MYDQAICIINVHIIFYSLTNEDIHFQWYCFDKQVFHILHAILWLKVTTGNYSGRLENRKKLMVGKIGYQLFIDKKIPEERFVGQRYTL